MSLAYQRIEDFEQEPFEDDVLVMHRWTRRALALNPAAAALWEALRWPHTEEDLAALLVEARPEQPEEQSRTQVREVLEELTRHGLVLSLREPEEA